MGLPEGRVTFLFTDIEGSTRLLHELGDTYAEVLARHHEILQAAIDAHDGHVFGTEGDAFAVAFARPEAALAAALDAQRGLAAERWHEGAAVRVRMGVHTGPVVVNATGYVGMALHETARISSTGHGGQVVVSAETERLSFDLPPGASFTRLGRHRLKDVPEPAELFQLAHKELHAAFPPLRALPDAVSNLPELRTTFLGRTEELEAVRVALGAARIVTVVGPGGAGKTRLATEAARRFIGEVRDGVWFVDLVGTSNTEGVHTAWANAFDLRPERDVERTIVDYVTALEGIVVVDNCEHVIDDAAELVDRVLTSAPQIRVVATSREPLRLAGEVSVFVGPLNPGEGQVLFVARAAEARPGYAPGPEELGEIDALCAALDHLPLALELAAARVATLSVKDIASHLHDRFRLLGSSRRGGDARHRTLLSAIEWSYDLLPPEAQLVLRRVAVLPRGFTPDQAAIAVGGEFDLLEVSDVLAQLVEKSLLVVQHTDVGTTFSMLESIESFGRDRLAEEGEELATRERLLRATLDMAAEVGPGIEGPEWRSHLALARSASRLTRSTLSWASAVGRHGDVFEIIGQLRRFWMLDTDYLENLRVCRAAIAAVGDRDSESIAEARARATLVGMDQSEGAELWHGEDRYAASAGLSAFRGCGDEWIDAMAELTELEEAVAAGEADQSRFVAAEQALREISSPFLRTNSLMRLGLNWYESSSTDSLRLFHETLETADALDHDLLRYFARLQSYRATDFGAAKVRLATESVDLARSVGAPLSIVSAIANLGRALMWTGEFAAANPYFAESEEFCRRTGDRFGLVDVLDERSRLQLWLGDVDGALRLAQEVLALARSTGLERFRGPVSLNVSATFIAAGHLDEAESLLDEADALDHARNSHLARTDVRASLARERGDFATSARLLLRALELAHEHPQRAMATRHIVASTAVLVTQRGAVDLKIATQLLAAAGSPTERLVPWKFRFDESIELCRSALGAEAFDAAWREGNAMTVDAAV
ncbi:MAG TPA: adenylate/guanylate cyclase domain-containing protein, partial [Acidimicrobiales bacterium]|nr:adenylate/guanylate cyclase domain-containing protein [Acidimicrobiales bacterium]